MMKALVRGELDQQDVSRREQQRLQSLAEKSFFYLTEDEIQRMQEAVTRLAQRLRNVISVRRRRARRGRFDSSATLRKNLQYGGVPFHVVFDRKQEGPAAGDGPLRRVRLGAQRLAVHAAVRLLAAGSLLEGAQLHLRRRPGRGHAAVRGAATSTQAIDEALRGDLINVYAHSDFGRAFKIFHRDHLAAVNGEPRSSSSATPATTTTCRTSGC